MNLYSLVPRVGGAAGLDGYPLRPDDPYVVGHHLLDEYLGDVPAAADYVDDRAVQITIVHAALERLSWLHHSRCSAWHSPTSHQYALEGLVQSLLSRRLPLGYDDMYHIVEVAALSTEPTWQPWRGILSSLERYVASYGLPPEFRPLLERQKVLLTRHYLRTAFRPIVLRIDAILGKNEHEMRDSQAPRTGAVPRPVAKIEWRGEIRDAGR